MLSFMLRNSLNLRWNKIDGWKNAWIDGYMLHNKINWRRRRRKRRRKRRRRRTYGALAVVTSNDCCNVLSSRTQNCNVNVAPRTMRTVGANVLSVRFPFIALCVIQCRSGVVPHNLCCYSDKLFCFSLLWCLNLDWLYIKSWRQDGFIASVQKSFYIPNHDVIL